MDIAAFLGAMLGTRVIEIAAVLLGVVNVLLIMRRTIWNYPFGIGMVVLYAWIFFEHRLYSDALLQVFYLVIQVFGIFWWLGARDRTGRVEVVSIAPMTLALSAGAAAVGSIGLGTFMAERTDADLPYWDATTTILSVIAQTLMMRRIVESWLVWIVVDVLSIGIYIAKSLVPTAVLYMIFLGLAVRGFVVWRNALRSGEGMRS